MLQQSQDFVVHEEGLSAGSTGRLVSECFAWLLNTLLLGGTCLAFLESCWMAVGAVFIASVLLVHLAALSHCRLVVWLQSLLRNISLILM